MSKRKQLKSSSKASIPDELLLRIANECPNPLDKLIDDNKEENNSIIQLRNRLKITNFEIELKYFRWSDLSSELQEWIIDLTETNMKELYDQCEWKWNKQSKLTEFNRKQSKYLIIFNVSNRKQPIAFVHFRFENGYQQSNQAVLYCYELQIEKSYQHKGLGQYLMNILAELAEKFHMKKLYVTVLKHNTIALNFYMNCLKFKIDKHSPSNFNQDVCYEILSKKIS